MTGRIRIGLVALGLLLAPAHLWAQDCPYLPEFKTLRQQLDTLTALEGAKALQAYAATHENPEACEQIELHRLLSIREKALVRLVLNGQEIPAQTVFRCNTFSKRLATCQSPMEDTTAHPFSAGILPMPMPQAKAPFLVVSDLPAARLVGLYRIALAEALDGKPATRLGRKNHGTWGSEARPHALMAIYKTPGPWAYRKAVWYFAPAEPGAMP